MNSTLNDQYSSIDMVQIPETMSMIPTNNKLTKDGEDENVDIAGVEIHQINQSTSSCSVEPIDDISIMLNKKHKSLISVYDNNPEEQQKEPMINCYPLIGIIGENQRSKAFTKRLLLSGFPKPILYNNNSKDIYNYVTEEKFYELSPSIIILADNLTNNIQDIIPQHKQQIIIDARENFRKTSEFLSSVPGSYQAFGNLSNWEIENGTNRVPIAVEQYLPSNLIKFIYDLNCSTRGIVFLDKYSYNNQNIKSFRHCLFPFMSTIIIFSLCFTVSMIEHVNDSVNESSFIYRQASSITGATSITVLAFTFLIRPILELIDFIHSRILNKTHFDGNVLPNSVFIQRWLQSRRYLVWYSLSFALLHIIFIIFSKIDTYSTKYSIYSLFFGIFTLIVLFILSYIHFPWISERILWGEYYFLTSYLGPLCILIGFIHIYLNWLLKKQLFNLKFLSMILPFIVLILRFIIYGILHSLLKRI